MRLPQLKTCDGASAGLIFLSDATALKAMHKAGRRGGDSIAREEGKHVCAGCVSGDVTRALVLSECSNLQRQNPA